MKEVTEIKAGQVWVTKASKAPIMIHEVGDYFVDWRWFEKNGAIKYSEEGPATFKNVFDFVADAMSEEDFKQWCMTGKKPTLKTATEIKDDEVIYQSQPVAHDPINHPKHYTSHPSGIETIGITHHMNFNRGNAIKCLMRAGLKDPAKEVEDLQKAARYIQDEIKRLKAVYNAILLQSHR